MFTVSLTIPDLDFDTPEEAVAAFLATAVELAPALSFNVTGWSDTENRTVTHRVTPSAETAARVLAALKG